MARKINPMTDDDLVKAIPYLNRYALMLTKDKYDADDLVSLTLLRALEIIRKKNIFIKRPRSWLAKVMWFRFVSYFCRKNKVERGEHQLFDYMGAVPCLGTILDIDRVFQANTKKDKSIIINHIKGYTAKSIATAMSGYRTSKPTVLKVIKNFKHDINAI